MSGFAGLGIRANGSVISDRETGAVSVLHDDCRRAFDALMADHGLSHRFADMGPGIVPDGSACNWTGCAGQ